jgi:hypothetical protein
MKPQMLKHHTQLSKYVTDHEIDFGSIYKIVEISYLVDVEGPMITFAGQITESVRLDSKFY